MKIDLSGWKNRAGGSARFVLTEEFAPGWLDWEGCVLHSPVTAELEVLSTGRSFLVQAQAGAELMTTCALCLAETVQSFRFSFTDEWLTAEQAAGAEAELLETALVCAQDEVDLDDRIREFFLLHLPMRFTCRPDCRGLCPSCGADLNDGDCSCRREETDPRFAGLLKLRDGV
ncbi:MAG: DUF177 domain-containing protein [Gracilibacteraceae bacterium]|jgi:uncharacterized protein|nr:DUF177 domain-containing protein [Gracilibacteraceae bacterium]